MTAITSQCHVFDAFLDRDWQGEHVTGTSFPTVCRSETLNYGCTQPGRGRSLGPDPLRQWRWLQASSSARTGGLQTRRTRGHHVLCGAWASKGDIGIARRKSRQ